MGTDTREDEMSKEGGDDGYVLPSTDREARRLEVQGAEMYGGTAFLEPFLASNPARVLDLGCGTGILTRHVASRLPEAEVLGVDLDESRLAFARQHGGIENLRFEKCDFRYLPFEDESFDLVFSRFVLIFVPDPGGAIQEMVRVTRPGGSVVCRDMVHDGIWYSPEKPAFAAVLSEVVSFMKSRGFEPSQGLHLAPAMVRAGLEGVHVEGQTHGGLAATPAFEFHRENWLATLEGFRETLAHLEPGLLELALGELRSDAPDQFLLEVSVVASGQKS